MRRIAWFGFALALEMILTATPGFGAPLSLPEALQIARDRSPDLKRVEAQAEGVSWKKQESLAAYAPKLNLKFDHAMLNRFQLMDVELGGNLIEIPAEYPLTTLTLEGSWTIFDGLAGWHTYRAARLDDDAAQLQLARARFQLEEDVRSKYYQALAAQFLARVARQNIQTLEEHLSDVRTRVQAGVATRFDLLRIEVQLEDAKTELIADEDQVVDTRQRLAQSLNMTLEELPAVLSDSLPVPDSRGVPANLSLDVKARPDLQALTLREESAERLRAASRAHWFPRFSFYGNTQYYNNLSSSMFDHSNYRNAFAVGFSLTWNLFDGLASYSRQQQAYYHSEEARYGLDASLLQAGADFSQSKRKFFYSIALYQARLRAIGKAEESVRLARIGVKAGTRTNMELLDAELDLMKTRAGVIRAQADALNSMLALELALGTRLPTGVQ